MGISENKYYHYWGQFKIYQHMIYYRGSVSSSSILFDNRVFGWLILSPKKCESCESFCMKHKWFIFYMSFRILDYHSKSDQDCKRAEKSRELVVLGSSRSICARLVSVSFVNEPSISKARLAARKKFVLGLGIVRAETRFIKTRLGS